MIAFSQVDLSWIIAFQSLGDWLLAPMKFFSFLGSEEFFIFFLPVIYWSLDAAMGIRFGVILLISGGLNDLFKLAFHSPRPYWVSAKIKAFAAETSFGLPSGHAQISVGVWGMAAAYLQRAWAWAVAVFLILMIGLSRPFLGVHFWGDVFVGWLLGAALLWLFLRYWMPVETWIRQQSFVNQVIFAFLVSLVIVLLNVFFLTVGQDGRQVALDAWTSVTTQAGVDKLPDPFKLSGTLTKAGTLFGLLTGLAWLSPRGGWKASGPAWKRVARYLVGLVGILLLWYGLGEIFPRGEAWGPYGWRYLRYALLGIWVSAGAPVIFMKLKLS